jgi:DNA-binding NarL/FixJ family response regulator
MIKILVIDDDDHLREEVMDTLRLEGFTAIEASNGIAGLELAREHLPNLIICDINMPEMDGYETLFQLRLDSQTSQIPFIFLSALDDYDSQRQGMRLGADDYLTKPFAPKDLLDAIAARLEKYRQAELSRAQLAAQQAMQALEDERRRLANELEHTVQQTLAGLRLMLKASQHIPVSTFETIFDQLLDDNRRLILTLYPTMLDQLGLLPTLLWYIDQFQETSKTTVTFEHNGLDGITDPAIRLGGYRILQHFFTLIEGRLKTLHLQMWVEAETLYITAQPSTRAEVINRTWYEDIIDNMQERMLSMGGHITIMKEEDQAVSIMWRVPLKRDMAARLPMPTPPPDLSMTSESRIKTPPTPAHPKDKITVAIADPNDITREGIHSILESEMDYIVVGEVNNGVMVLDLVRQLQPQILILDLMMPNLSGIHIAREITRQRLKTHILMLSTQVEQAYVLESLRAGAVGYALKQSSREDLVAAINHTAKGIRYLSHVVSEQALQVYLDERLTENQSLDGYQTLTPREREILQLLAEGFKNAQIAQMLSISPRTAETHRANLMRKLGLESQVDLVRYAIQRGLISLQQ